MALSYCLTQQQRPQILLEKTGQLADAWRNHRWDLFTLVTPNWHIRLPGGAYRGEDPDGFPIQRRGVTAFPGLYFLGLPWLHTGKSGLLLRIGEDAEYIATQIAGRG